MMEWLNVLEMGVKFESEENEMLSTRGPHRKAIAAPSNLSQSPEKRAPKQSAIEPEEIEPKPAISKFKDISKHVNGKLERRKRKYKKKEVEYISWYYEDINDAKLRDLIDVMSLLTDNQENQQFYEYLYTTAFIQSDDEALNKENKKLVEQSVVPTLLSHGRPIFLNQAVK